MRKTELEECALPNLKGSGSCKVLPGSRCSKRDSCSSYLWALSFPDDICLVIANVNSSALIAQVQVFNYFNGECLPCIQASALTAEVYAAGARSLACSLVCQLFSTNAVDLVKARLACICMTAGSVKHQHGSWDRHRATLPNAG